MDQNWVLIAVSAVFSIAFVGFFATKTAGFGKFNTSLLILMLVLYAGLIIAMFDITDLKAPLNLIFAVAGYAAALLTGVSKKEIEKEEATN